VVPIEAKPFAAVEPAGEKGERAGVEAERPSAITLAVEDDDGAGVSVDVLRAQSQSLGEAETAPHTGIAWMHLPQELGYGSGHTCWRTFHTLRYFYISMVRAQGLPSAITEQLVGHVDERTHRGYTRPIPGTEPLIRAALTAAFQPPETGGS
jgi:hypothetical protein